MPAKLTPSGMWRAGMCPPSCALPAVYTPPGDGAVRGGSTHSYLSAYLEGASLLPILETCPPHALELLKSIDLAQVDCLVGPGQRHIEQPFALDVRTGVARELPKSRKARDYRAAGPQEIAGTADVIVVEGASTVTVIDWKSGPWSLDMDEVHSQVNVYALAAVSLYGATRARCVAAVLSEDGAIAPLGWVLEAPAMQEVQQGLLGIWEGVEAARDRVEHGRTVDVSVGQWCRYCPSLLSCPATVGVTARLEAGSPGEAYLAALRVEKLAKMARQRLRLLVEAQGEARWTDDAGREWALRFGSDGAMRQYKVKTQRVVKK